MAYEIIIQREPEKITCKSYEEAEQKMKALYDMYGERPSKYFMLEVKGGGERNSKITRYDCDKNGNVVENGIGY